MRSAVVRRSVLAASAVSLSLLVTACGSGDSKSDAKSDAKPDAKASASAAPAAKAKTAAELAPLLVTQADLPDHKIGADKSIDAAQSEKVTTDKAACQPLVELQSFKSAGTPAGTAHTGTTENSKAPSEGASVEEKLNAITDKLSATRTVVILSSYEGKATEETLAAVKSAVTACAAGYTVTAGTEVTKVEKAAASTAVTAGDEAFAFNTTIDLKDGQKNTMEFVVVRKGNVLASFASVSGAGQAKQPKTVVEAQVKKLG
ncbi:hypothetical protein [Streptomyces sp. NPDC048606]|uniref:hypothetical protein n=1 Tax=Streptomyces sp. NPDC048606 TaxID=3154726 RepID=UPI003435F49A